MIRAIAVSSKSFIQVDGEVKIIDFITSSISSICESLQSESINAASFYDVDNCTYEDVIKMPLANVTIRCAKI